MHPAAHQLSRDDGFVADKVRQGMFKHAYVFLDSRQNLFQLGYMLGNTGATQRELKQSHGKRTLTAD
ncbi:MAG TPA: hypothetical protein VJW55_20815 [Candidatus Angelobacter sp.]|nr:hypothetical protein [Candidatus Angelobacter sp.]